MSDLLRRIHRALIVCWNAIRAAVDVSLSPITIERRSRRRDRREAEELARLGALASPVLPEQAERLYEAAAERLIRSATH